MNSPRSRRAARRPSNPAVSPPRVGDLCRVMEEIAPSWAAAEWDNVGLLAGDISWPAQRLLLTIDLTPAVLAEARRRQAQVIIAYHPPVFRPIKRLISDPRDPAGLAAWALAERIAVYSPHTALDAAPGGTNDALAELCGLTEVKPLERSSGGARRCKLVVFVPPNDVEQVADAVFMAGGGRIGAYEKCSFRLRGEGTFFGSASTNPVVGQRGRLERVDEIRLEVVFPEPRLPDIVAALRRSHPYEEPAFDVYPLQPVPDGQHGQGRIGRFAEPITLPRLLKRIAEKTAARHITHVEPPSATPSARRPASRVYTRGLICVGAAGSLPFEAAGPRCGPGDVVITGEIRHHDALRYQRLGVAAVAVGHWASERPVLSPLADRLRRMLPGVSVKVSQADADPFRPMSRT